MLRLSADCWYFFFFSRRRRHTRLQGDWSSDVCSSDLAIIFNASEQTADSPNENRAGRSSRANAALARLDGRALDGEEPLEIDHGEQVLLDRAPVGLRRDLRAKAVGEVRVDLLPRRVGCEQGRQRIGDDPVAEA